jgi:hypothetical protein
VKLNHMIEHEFGLVVLASADYQFPKHSALIIVINVGKSYVVAGACSCTSER